MSRNRDKIERALNVYTRLKLTRIEKKKVTDPRRQALINEVQLNEEQLSKIDSLFQENFGKKVPHDWHRLYQSFTGSFRENYFPELLFSTYAEPKFNSWSYRYVLDDKLLLSVFTSGVDGVKTPDMIGGFANGVYFDQGKNVLDKDEFVRLLQNAGECIFKQTKDTDSGAGIKLANLGGVLAKLKKLSTPIMDNRLLCKSW